MLVHHRRPLHTHLSAFVDWIATDPSREERIREQADEIRARIVAKAKEDGLVVQSTPWSGSYKKRTGLRRHMQGRHPVEGQDVDLPFVISPTTKEDEQLACLIPRFYRYADTSYPQTTKRKTKSSVKLEFSASKLSYDLVPMLEGPEPETQILIRSDGERRKTSIQKHTEFVRKRTQASNDMPGRVKFNECVRLFKWWREVMTEGEIDRYPTMLIDLLCAHAFDRLGVEETYPDTLARWVGYLASAVARREPIYFSDFTPWSSPPALDQWAVIDPVNQGNNVAARLSRLDVQVLAGWLAEARDNIAQAVSCDIDDDDSGGLEALGLVFGNPILNHNNGT